MSECKRKSAVKTCGIFKQEWTVCELGREFSQKDFSKDDYLLLLEHETPKTKFYKASVNCIKAEEKSQAATCMAYRPGHVASCIKWMPLVRRVTENGIVVPLSKPGRGQRPHYKTISFCNILRVKFLKAKSLECKRKLPKSAAKKPKKKTKKKTKSPWRGKSLERRHNQVYKKN